MVFFSRLVAVCALNCCSAVLAFAVVDATRGHPLSSDIPAGPLPQALATFADQTGLQLVYQSTLADGRISQSAPAGLPAAQALGRLLAGTGIDFIFLNSRTIKLVPQSLAARPPGRPTEFSALEEIVVTATKRDEFLSDVPVSATVFSAEAMRELGMKSFVEIAAMTPGVEYDFSTQWGAGILTNLAIRGIDSNVGTSTTGVYIDDAPIQARNANFGNPYPVTFDLARVEVLRGPQGTLFGAGAEGGAIRFVANSPNTTTFDVLYHAELSTTEYGGMSYETGAAIGGPIVDGRVGARLSAWYQKMGGYVDRVDPLTDVTVDKNANESWKKAVRLSFALEPFDTVRITPSLAYQSVRLADTPSFYTYLSDPGAGVFRNGKLLAQPAEDSFSATSIKFEAPLGICDFTAITSYFDRTASATVDTTNVAGIVYFGGFGNPLGPAYPTAYADAIPTQLGLHQIVLSQEVRFTSGDGNAPLKWVSGFFYSRARQDDVRDTYAIAMPTSPGIDTDDLHTDTLAAGFANIDVAIAQRLRMSVGVRIDYTRSEFTEYAGGFAYGGVPPHSNSVTDETPVTPLFSIEFEPAQHSRVYAVIAKGFRIGGTNIEIPAECGSSPVPPSYGSDSVWSYEMGTKDTVADGRLRFSASTYYLRWNNIQEHEVFHCGFGFVANAGAATGKGFDLSADALLSDRIGVGVALGNTDVRYTRTVTAGGNVIVDSGTVVGGVPSVPSPWIGIAYIRSTWSIANGRDIYARAEDIVHSHNPGPFTELDPKSVGYDPAYRADPSTNQLNLHLGLLAPSWDVELFVNNATNSHPLLQLADDAPGSSLLYAYTLRPRTVGLASNWKF